jgi:serine/threonine-protein kinase
MEAPMSAARWARVKDLVARAIELDAAAREALLAEASGEDLPLRREVESLLAAHDAAGDFIEAPAAAGLFGSGSSLEGARLGPYRLEREIGRGGMGAVYLAVRADDAYEKRVAIKVIKRGMDSDEIVRRFRHERQTLANLDHPNIARLLDGGTTSEGLPYFVMEYVEGEPLDEYCRSRTLGESDRLRLFRTVCGAVEVAHRNLVVHRDLKPDNILVTAEGVPKLLDFGIAKLLGAGEDGVVTRDTDRLLTLQYASPEQLRGEPVSTATDVFSLGVMLYELLSGVHPFERAGQPRAALEHAILEEEPRGGRLERELEAIARTALRKEPDRRYGSVFELSDDIGRYLSGLPVRARGDAVGYRLSKFVRRHAVGVAAAAVVVLALVGGIIGVSWQARIAARERDRARLEANKAQQVSAVLQRMLRAADPSADGRDVRVADVLAEASRRAGLELQQQPEIRAAVRAAIGGTYYSLGLYDDALRELEESATLARSTFGEESVEFARARVDLARVAIERGDAVDAEAEYRAALATLERAGAAADETRADTLVTLGQFVGRNGDNAAAVALYDEALAIRLRLYGGDHEAVAEILNNLAVQAQARSDVAEAERLYREALRITTATRGERHPGYAVAASNLAGVLHTRRLYEEARALYERALALRRELQGPDHPDVAFTEFNLAELLFDSGQPAAALVLAQRVLARRGVSIPDAHPVIAAALVTTGKARLKTGDLAGAERDLRDSVARRRAMLPPGHWLIANTESVLGECLLAAGKRAEAERLLVASYERLLADRGPDHERTRDARARLALLQ